MLVSLVFLAVNILALFGIVRSSSWNSNQHYTSHKLVYPWLILYFLANCSFVPLAISLVYLWFERSPECSNILEDGSYCQDDILYFWSPLIGFSTVVALSICLINWMIMLNVTRSMKNKLNPEPFLRLGSRIVFGLQHTSHSEGSTKYSTLSKNSTLFSYGHI